MNPYQLITAPIQAFVYIRSFLIARNNKKQTEKQPVYISMPKETKDLCLSIWPDFGKKGGSND